MTIRRFLALPALLSLGLAIAQSAEAQGSGEGFLFREPSVSLGLRGGFNHANAGSDIFSFATEHLTLGRGDFSGPAVGADLGIRLFPRVDLVVGTGYAGASAASEFREWVEGEDDLPIEQTTRFQQVPVTAGVKAYLTPRGRSIGQFAWIPAAFAPYVGAGGGGVWYRFRQQGDFVDIETLEIFTDELESSGWAPAAHGLAGLDVSLTPRIALTGEARYSWGSAELGNAFEGFEPIDLSGVSATVGITFRF